MKCREEQLTAQTLPCPRSPHSAGPSASQALGSSREAGCGGTEEKKNKSGRGETRLWTGENPVECAELVASEGMRKVHQREKQTWVSRKEENTLERE